MYCKKHINEKYTYFCNYYNKSFCSKCNHYCYPYKNEKKLFYLIYNCYS